MEKVDEGLKNLVDTGKSKGYLTYDQVNDYLPDEAVSPEKLDNLLRFYDELGQMPRDLELSPEVIEGAFYRAFDLLADPNDPTKVDQAKLDQLEQSWRGNLFYQMLEVDTSEKLGPGTRPGGDAPGKPGGTGS